MQDPEGQVVRLQSGAPFAMPAVGQTVGWHEIRRYKATLMDLGVIPREIRRKAKERHHVRKATTGLSNPLVIARTVLQTPSSTSKERALAREVLRQAEQIGKLQELARRLGAIIKSLES